MSDFIILNEGCGECPFYGGATVNVDGKWEIYCKVLDEHLCWFPGWKFTSECPLHEGNIIVTKENKNDIA